MIYFSVVMSVGAATVACSILIRDQGPSRTYRANRHAQKNDNSHKPNNKSVLIRRTMMTRAASRAQKTLTSGTCWIITLIRRNDAANINKTHRAFRRPFLAPRRPNHRLMLCMRSPSQTLTRADYRI